MLSIEDKQNKSLSNFGFDIKKQKLQKMKFTDLFEQVPELRIYNFDHWDHEAINKRSKEIKSSLAKKFKGLSIK